MATDGLTEQLNYIFHPRTVAIIGASNKAGSFGNSFVDGFIRMEFKEIIPVHPTEPEILGLKAYSGVKEIPQDVDLAIILTPPATVAKIMEECTDKGVKGIIIFTAGFGEKDEEGKRLEKEFGQIARKRGSRVIGPNCIGVYSPLSRLLTFPDALIKTLPSEAGTIGCFSQSGSLVDYLTYIACDKGIRFSKVISCGNECDLGSIDFLEYLGDDEDTKVIAGYLEGIKDGKRFYQQAKRISARKPIIIWKTGATESGAKAASSHTGALAGSNQVWNAVFQQTGIISVTSFEEIIDCMLGFYFLPLPKGKRVVIVTAQGGTGVGTADNCIRMGLEMAKISDETLDKLREIIPPMGASISNPMDLGVAAGVLAPHLYGEAVKLIGADENVDMLIVSSSPNPKAINSICEAGKGLGKPLVVSLFKLPEQSQEEYKAFAESGIPAYSDAKRAAFVLSRMAGYAEYQAQVKEKE